MDAVYYKGTMERNIKDSANKLGLGRLSLFQQDNDPKHTFKITRTGQNCNIRMGRSHQMSTQSNIYGTT